MTGVSPDDYLTTPDDPEGRYMTNKVHAGVAHISEQ
jgi:hypothetical protein